MEPNSFGKMNFENDEMPIILFSLKMRCLYILIYVTKQHKLYIYIASFYGAFALLEKPTKQLDDYLHHLICFNNASVK